MIEIWNDIERYEGLYRVSNLGRVKSLPRFNRGEKILKPDLDGGYLKVSLYKSGRRTRFLIHRLVCSSFRENTENRPSVNHLDGNKLNNSIDNLEWATMSENIQHAFDTGLHSHVGSKNTFAKLVEKDILLIRKLKSEYNIRIKTISWIFGVSTTTIKDIFAGKTWTHVE